MTALLEPLRFALQGRSLVEASAGTGKTWTIAALYLRLVLGHGSQEARFARALTPPQILVVTFTEAATKELRDRIRSRLAQAAVLFAEDPAAASTGDDFLDHLRAEYPPAEWPARARELRLAAEWMDEAAVSTIHGWCNRMLREHAFASGSLFTQTLEGAQDDLLDEALRDYWRTFFYPLPAADARCVGDWWRTPAVLGEALQPLLQHVGALAPAPAPAVSLAAAREASARELAELRAPWGRWADELEALFEAGAAAGQVHGQKLQARHYRQWLQDLRDWAAGLREEPLRDPKGRGWTRLTPQGLQEAWKGQPPDHPALHAMAVLGQRLACLPQARAEVLRHAAHWVERRLAEEQQRRARMGFNDLLTQLSAALHGPNGVQLAAMIRAQFPVALIDEFQDTDPLQYGIFRAIYGTADGPDTALVLIGDPKQAIYAFRGADIHTYLAARRDTEGRHATLGTNFRSTAAMVEAVNRFFQVAEARATGEGAFLFRTPTDNPLPFVPVRAQGRDERWLVQGVEAPALTCWWLPAPEGPLKPGQHLPAMASGCAAEIVRLLRLGQAGEAVFAGAGGARALQAGDIAVLVNTGREAREVRQALAALGVRSVYLSDQDNVFGTPAAAEIHRLLQACAEPEDERLLRAALASALLGLSWAALDQLRRDELLWEQRVLQFRAYRQQWRRQGVLPMLRRLLHDFAVPQRLIAAEDERQLTDVLHLAELLQQASRLLEGEHALLRHLAQQREDPARQEGERQLRLESDADLVKVVTVHKSKGLEYPLVFVPFASACRVTRPGDLPLKWHDTQGRLQLALEADDAVLAQADRERLGEDLRKLYVALTRGRFATWVGVAPLEQFERSAMGYLLAGGEPVPPAELPALLHANFAGCAAVAVQPVPAHAGERFVARAQHRQLAPEPPLPRRRAERWWIASYSALRVAGEAPIPAEANADDPPVPSSAQEDVYREAAVAAGGRPDFGVSRFEAIAGDAGAGDPGDAAGVAVQPASTAPAAGGLHAFPRGASAGSFLHGVLEAAGRGGFQAALTTPGELEALVASRCEARGWQHWAAPLAAWLRAWLATPLDLRPLGAQAQVRLDALRDPRVEMEFWFPASHVDAEALDALVQRHMLAGAVRPRLLPQQLNGMLKGFIDLLFEHEGRFYVADYKSNWLGPDDAGYTAGAMRDEVLRHRYELQYALYVFALHRLLRTRLPDYDYDRHVGGAVFLFLRGHAAPSRGLHLERPPRALVEAMDALFGRAPQPEAGA